MPPGTYEFWATWVASSSNATSAQYSITDFRTQVGTAGINQQNAPSQGQYGGVLWDLLGTVVITDGRRITVKLTANASANVVADAILVTAAGSSNAGSRAAGLPGAGASASNTSQGPIVVVPPMTTTNPAIPPAGTTATATTAASGQSLGTRAPVITPASTRNVVNQGAVDAVDATLNILVSLHDESVDQLFGLLAQDQITGLKRIVGSRS